MRSRIRRVKTHCVASTFILAHKPSSSFFQAVAYFFLPVDLLRAIYLLFISFCQVLSIVAIWYGYYLVGRLDILRGHCESLVIFDIRISGQYPFEILSILYHITLIYI